MAKANWVKVNPASGSGNATVNVSSASEHTGRKARTSTLTWKAANVQDVVRNVSQAGKPEYVDIADAASADKAGKVVTISGVSNSAKLTFSFGTGDLTNITLPNTYTANSVSTSNGAAISGDPGALAEYNFSITINVPANNQSYRGADSRGRMGGVCSSCRDNEGRNCRNSYIRISQQHSRDSCSRGI